MELLQPIGIIWGISIVLGIIIGARKGMGCLGLIGCLILGPVGVIIVIVTKGYKVYCIHCRKTISRKAVVCPYCQKSQDPSVIYEDEQPY
jgi:hypothetical protein